MFTEELACVNIYIVKRTTVYFEEGTDLELARLAKRQGSSKAELIHLAVSNLLSEHKRRELKPLPAWVGAGRSGSFSTNEKTDELLGELYEADYKAALESWEEHKKREHSS
ncbi:hypothetical protein BH24DEI2_BH24DEI2_22170 [soil metagenome]